MKLEIIYKIYPTELELKRLTNCKSYVEMSKVHGIPRTTIKSWNTNGILLSKLYHYFSIEVVNNWILQESKLSYEKLKESEHFKDQTQNSM